MPDFNDTQREYKDVDILIDQVCDWIGQKWTESMIAFKLREKLDPGLKRSTVKHMVKQAKTRIMQRYHISPEDYKGEQIAWYEYVQRGKSFTGYGDGAPAKMCDRLRAAERLDALLNLENISNDDPAEQAKKIHAFLRAAEATVSQEDEKPDKPIANEEQGDEVNEQSGQS